MNVWLCPVKPKSWRTIRNKRLYGVPERERRKLLKTKPGDLLIFHILQPVNGIVSISRVISEVFEDHEDMWGRNRYPFRVKLEFLRDLTREEHMPIPLSVLFRRMDSKNGVRIEPYLRNVCITGVSMVQFEYLRKAFSIETSRPNSGMRESPPCLPTGLQTRRPESKRRY